MLTTTTFRHRIRARRQRSELQRILRHAEARQRDELMTIAQRDLNWS